MNNLEIDYLAAKTMLGNLRPMFHALLVSPDVQTEIYKLTSQVEEEEKKKFSSPKESILFNNITNIIIVSHPELPKNTCVACPTVQDAHNVIESFKTNKDINKAIILANVVKKLKL